MKMNFTFLADPQPVGLPLPNSVKFSFFKTDTEIFKLLFTYTLEREWGK
jgi:hypothetical protein